MLEVEPSFVHRKEQFEATLKSLVPELRKSFDFSKEDQLVHIASCLNRESSAALAVHHWDSFSVIYLLFRVYVCCLLNKVVHRLFWINRFLHHDNGTNNEIVILYAGSVDLRTSLAQFYSLAFNVASCKSIYIATDIAHLLFNPRSVSTSGEQKASKRDILKIISEWMSNNEKFVSNCIRSRKLIIVASARGAAAINKLRYTRSSYKTNGFVLAGSGTEKMRSEAESNKSVIPFDLWSWGERLIDDFNHFRWCFLLR